MLGTGSDSEVIAGPDVILLIREEEGTVNEVVVVGKEPVLKEVSYLELAIVVFSVLSFDAVVDNDSDGIEIVLTDVSMCVSGDEWVVVGDVLVLTGPVLMIVSDV